MSGQFISFMTPPQEQAGPAWWFIFKGHRMLVSERDDKAAVPLLKNPDEIRLPILHTEYLGTLDGRDCYAASVAEPSEPPDGMVFQGLRQLYGYVEEGLYKVAFRAVQIVDWHRTHQFCGRCGTRTESREDVRAKECPNCGFVMFPRISPAVIVLVERDDKALLARANRFSGNFYSVLAGFVEPGETLEETVSREIQEEVGIQVKDIRYFGSQSWPFPDSLMIAFTAKYAGGEIRIDGEEILDAQWFEAGTLPDIPGKISISRQLIDWFVAKHTKK